MSSSSNLEWSLHVVSKEHQLGQSYTVLFFLGPIPEAEEDWRSTDSLLGIHVSYTWTGHVQDERDHEIESFISLQRALSRTESGLVSLTHDHVLPYLHDNLQWRVQKSDGEVVRKDQLPSLKVSVFSMDAGQKERNEKTEYLFSLDPTA